VGWLFADCPLSEKFRASCRCFLGWVFCAIAVFWCTHAATKTLVAAMPSLQEQRLLVAFPCLLMFSMYALLTIY
jgi:hypothetical protein